MEGKAVILSVLIMSLLMSQIQVEAKKPTKSCCPSTTARNIYNGCRKLGSSRDTCASLSGCQIVYDGKCPKCCPKLVLEKSGDDVNEYCNLGCASSVCGALTTLENSGASEIVNEALEECTKACSTLCTTGSKTERDQIALDQIA